MEQLTKNQAVATSQEAVQNQNEPQLRDENAHNDKSVHGVLNPTYQAGLRRDARSEERRVGKECSAQWRARHWMKQKRRRTITRNLTRILKQARVSTSTHTKLIEMRDA